ncbi:Bile salt sulfotransferase [Sciurus carolinensis]|uniref:Sulfotransferase n=1 Tax=Sciurus carolinensis TaxID=30640 RepID=A0AA41MKV3_SCICA|nr:Bile salt sulfotransferase [Sciurus carolinensis]
MTHEFLWFEGLPFPDFGYSSEVIKEACTKFVIKDEDTVMVSYPKSGKESVQKPPMRKVLYIMRNPKDVLVSGYYFWTASKLSKKPESLEQYFKWFIQGNEQQEQMTPLTADVDLLKCEDWRRKRELPAILQEYFARQSQNINELKSNWAWTL